MNFEIPRTLYKEEHEIFRDSVARFLTNEVLPHYGEWETAGRTPPEIWRRAGELGLLGTSIPEEHGGMGGDFMFDAIVIEELGRHGVTLVSSFTLEPTITYRVYPCRIVATAAICHATIAAPVVPHAGGCANIDD